MGLLHVIETLSHWCGEVLEDFLNGRWPLLIFDNVLEARKLVKEVVGCCILQAESQDITVSNLIFPRRSTVSHRRELSSVDSKRLSLESLV